MKNKDIFKHIASTTPPFKNNSVLSYFIFLCSVFNEVHIFQKHSRSTIIKIICFFSNAWSRVLSITVRSESGRYFLVFILAYYLLFSIIWWSQNRYFSLKRKQATCNRAFLFWVQASFRFFSPTSLRKRFPNIAAMTLSRAGFRHRNSVVFLFWC